LAFRGEINLVAGWVEGYVLPPPVIFRQAAAEPFDADEL
jgi:hypothetical protein